MQPIGCINYPDAFSGCTDPFCMDDLKRRNSRRGHVADSLWRGHIYFTEKVKTWKTGKNRVHWSILNGRPQAPQFWESRIFGTWYLEKSSSEPGLWESSFAHQNILQKFKHIILEIQRTNIGTPKYHIWTKSIPITKYTMQNTKYLDLTRVWLNVYLRYCFGEANNMLVILGINWFLRRL